jgi:octaprenyl-diphosphate synthase
LGTAYQIYDDCVDLFGSESTVGKSLGTDLASGKLTLPLLVVLERARPEEVRELHELIAHWDGRQRPRLHSLLRNHQALEESRRVIHDFLQAACCSLTALPDTRNRSALAELTRFLAKQTGDLGLEPTA